MKNVLTFASLLSLGCGLVITSIVAAPAVSGTNANAKILLHLTSPAMKNICAPAEATPSCSEMVTQGLLYPNSYFAYLVVADADAGAGISAIECGLEYNGAPQQGVDIFSWGVCGSMVQAFNNWPASGGGARIVWDPETQCHNYEPGGAGTGVVAAGCYFYCAAYSPDRMKIIQDNFIWPYDYDCQMAYASASVVNCAGETEFLISTMHTSYPECIEYEVGPAIYPLGYISFSADGTTPGYNPCATAVPVLPTTWSRIKTMSLRLPPPAHNDSPSSTGRRP